MVLIVVLPSEGQTTGTVKLNLVKTRPAQITNMFETFSPFFLSYRIQKQQAIKTNIQKTHFVAQQKYAAVLTTVTLETRTVHEQWQQQIILKKGKQKESCKHHNGPLENLLFSIQV